MSAVTPSAPPSSAPASSTPSPGAPPPSAPPPSAESDPFLAARAANLRRLVRGGLVLGVLLLVVGVGVGLFGGRRALRPALPVGVVTQLRATSLASPVDELTGYLRLASLLPAGAALEAAALAEDGTLAIALHDGEQRLLVLRDGHVSAALLRDSRVSVLAFTPESELYVGFDDGRIAALSAGSPATALADAARGAAPASTVTGFAFDRTTPKTAVLFAGGEVFTALRPFRADALHAVTIPPNARVRLGAFTHDSELVLAGDRGQVFVSHGDEWDAVPLATSGEVVALTTDLAGDLLVAQANGEVFRRDGGWESLGRTPAPPVAIGELGAPGIVAILNDGRVMRLADPAANPTAIAGYVPRGAAVSGQVAGVNVLVLSRERLVVAQPGQTPLAWTSDESRGETVNAEPTDCGVIGAPANRALAPPLPLLVCGGEPVVLAASGALTAAPRINVAGRELPASEFRHLIRAGRDISYVAQQLVRAHHDDEAPGLLGFRPTDVSYAPLVTLPGADGPIVAWSAAAGEGGSLELVAVAASGSVRFARVAAVSPAAAGSATPVPVAAELVASRTALERLRMDERLPRVVALGGGHLLLLYPGLPTLVARLDASAPERLEPVPLHTAADEPDAFADESSALFAAGGAGWFARPGLLERIGPTGDGARVAEGVTLWLAPGTIAVDTRGRMYALATRSLPGGTVATVVLSCDATRCTERGLPAGVDPLRVFLTADEKLGIVEHDGRLGRFTR